MIANTTGKISPYYPLLFTHILSFQSNISFYDRLAIILPLICAATGIFACLAVFSVLGHLAFKMGKADVSDFVDSGPSVAFIAYLEALTQIPGVSIFTVYFFGMLFALGLDSQVGRSPFDLTALSITYLISNLIYGKIRTPIDLKDCILIIYMLFLPSFSFIYRSQ